MCTRAESSFHIEETVNTTIRVPGSVTGEALVLGKRLTYLTGIRSSHYAFTGSFRDTISASDAGGLHPAPAADNISNAADPGVRPVGGSQASGFTPPHHSS
jgi:hypothetical protein